jgi:hypothetical protein
VSVAKLALSSALWIGTSCLLVFVMARSRAEENICPVPGKSK